MRIHEIFTEAVGEQLVYHSSTPANMIKALEQGYLIPYVSENDSEMDVEKPSISTSRNQFYRFPYGNGISQFVLDKDAIRKSGFKIEPFSYFRYFGTPGPDYVSPPTGHTMHKQETEERISSKDDRPLPLAKPILVGIQYDSEKLEKHPEYFNKLQDYARKLAIPMQPFKKHVPVSFKAGVKKFTPNELGNTFDVTDLGNGLVNIQLIEPNGRRATDWQGKYSPEQIEYIKQANNGLLDPKTPWPK